MFFWPRFCLLALSFVVLGGVYSHATFLDLESQNSVCLKVLKK